MNLEKPNFQKELDALITDVCQAGRKPSLLLHSCCGPCSSYCLSYLKEYFDITVFYYNPNIYPEAEYDHRLSEQIRLIEELNREDSDSRIKIIHQPYDHEEFLQAAAGLEGEPEGGRRCAECFRFRLEKTAQLAGEKGFEYFGTTLTVSPHKNAVIINDIGRNIRISAASDDMPSWLPSDFKKKDGYKKSIELSHLYNLYRQNYCGCEFSFNIN